ncbi:hypothetical protein O1D40_001448 [Vibrio cholerae]|nr:hypothetical protein [Vibrio cholerae]EKF9630612.1 hypothetical protein [Vibrio cholerae]EKF9819458.1 hypothetical protein [Vibrio cholerae]
MMKISQTKQKVLNEFEARPDDWSFGDFERSLETAMGKRYGNYQTAKLTIIEADKDGRWPKTVEQYIRSNFKAFGNLPVELKSIGSRFNLS